MGPFWVMIGKVYRNNRLFLKYVGSVNHMIGSYGPFKLDSEFAFSDFEHWGDKHNNGFNACVEMCRDKNCVLDVGGHIGLVTMPVSKVLAPGGMVHAFEPAEANLKHLLSHISKNRLHNVTVENSLVGNEEKNAVKFYEQNTATGQNALAIKKDHELYSETIRSQITLDSYCEKNKLEPEIIKIDVEGAEYSVLQGAKNIITRYKPVIFLSLHPVELKLLNSSVEDVVKYVSQDLNYVMTEIDGSEIKEFHLAEYLLKPKMDQGNKND